MSTITLKGTPIHTVGQLPALGTQAPDFSLTQADLTELTLGDCLGQSIILNIFPSLDTPTCAQSVRHFNEIAAKLPNTRVLCISVDLPFAHKRFCTTENIDNITTVSCFRHPEFGIDYGVTIEGGKLGGLLSRAVLILDAKGKVIYAEQVPEISSEPNYDAALQALT